MKHKKLLCILLLVTLAMSSLFALVACDNKNGKPEKITFVLDWTPNTNHTGLYVAKHLGYYADEGLEVSFIQPGMDGSSVDVSTGVGQFGIDFQEQMIFNEQSSINVTAVAAVVQHNTSGILVKGGIGIETLADITGHSYATWGLPGEQAIVKYFAEKYGGRVNDSDMVPNTVANIIAEFQNPQGVDSVWSYAAWDVIRLELAGIDHKFFRMSDIEVLDYYTPVIIANNDYLKKYPEYARKFVKATAAGYKYAIEHPAEAAEILMKENPELREDEALILASMNFLKSEYQADAPKWGYIDQTRWDNFFALMSSLVDEITTPISKGYGFTNEFLPA